MKFLRNLFGTKENTKVSTQVIEDKMDNARNTFSYIAGLLLIVSSLFASQTVNAQLKIPAQKVTATEIVQPMQGIVGIDFGGFEYTKIYADGNTVVFIMEFNRADMIAEAQSITPEQKAKLSEIFTASIVNNRPLVLQMKNNDLNLRIVLLAGNVTIFDETKYASTL